MMRFVQIHRDFFLDHLAFLYDFGGAKLRMVQHVHQHIEQIVETVMTSARVEAGRFFAGKRVEITADAFDRFGNLFGKSVSLCPLKSRCSMKWQMPLSSAGS